MSGREAGEHLHCVCGRLLRVPTAPAEGQREAAVVRCAACGGPREGGALRCAYCGADFTSAERDRDTLCPGCAGRIGRASRFCPYCGVRIAPEPLPVAPTELPCPVCREGRSLRCRDLGRPDGLVLLECPRCGGVWLSEPVLRVLEREARARESADTVPDARRAEPRPSAMSQPGPFYRRCPHCANTMNRVNYGRASGIVVDVCKEHGVWFDEEELGAALDWVRAGGLRRAEERRRLQLEEAERRARVERRMAEREQSFLSRPASVGWGEAGRLLDDLAEFLVGFFGK